jgi:hypothetical protein
VSKSSFFFPRSLLANWCDEILLSCRRHHESEAQKRINDLNRLRVHVEDVLRHNVADNYRIFMQATREIQRMNSEIAELKQAVHDTSAVVSNLSTMKLSTQLQLPSTDRADATEDDPLTHMRDSSTFAAVQDGLSLLCSTHQ